MLFADDAAVAAHRPSRLQSLMNSFANVYTAFGLTISLKKVVVKQPHSLISLSTTT